MFLGHSVAGERRNLSPMRYVVGHFLHVFAYIPLTRVQLFIDKPRPFAQIETDAGAHVQIFTAEGIPSGTEALMKHSNGCPSECNSHCGDDSVVLCIQSPSSPASWHLGSRRYLFGDPELGVKQPANNNNAFVTSKSKRLKVKVKDSR